MTLFTALQKSNESAEAVLYSSLYWDSFEHANATNTSAMADAYLNQNPDKETDFRGKVKENDYSVIPKLKDDFHDVFAELEKELAKDQMTDIDANERDDDDEEANDVNLVKGKPSKNEEVLPNIGYALPHNVKKHPSELNGRQDSFENPYARQPIQPAGYPMGAYPPQQGYPQYPQYPQYPVPQVGGGYGRRRRKRRAKRQTSGSDDTYDAHWGIHRIMSTGKQITMWKFFYVNSYLSFLLICRNIGTSTDSFRQE